MAIKIINTQRVLSPTQITLADYAINPYRGCEFGCIYCYALQNKNIKDNNKILGIKINAPSVLEKELRYKFPKRVLLGSTTECFQYKESEYKITEKILILLNSRKIPYTILTKSNLISRYLPIISENKDNKIYFTLNLSSNKLIRIFEEKTPSIEERIKAIKAIVDHKINLRIHIGPFIPYISSLKAIMRLLPKSIEEINVELYHHKMGNFKEIIDTIRKNFGEDTCSKISAVYASKKNYLEFASEIEKMAITIKNPSQEFFFILPDFDDYYNDKVDYKDGL